MRTEYSGDILAVREIEDCIRATKKYTKGAFRKPVRHPIQGEEFPSKVLTEYYEVYPDFDLEEKTSLWSAALNMADWLWGDITHIDIQFHYTYKENLARMVVYGGNGTVQMLKDGIPGFGDAISKLSRGGNGKH